MTSVYQYGDREAAIVTLRRIVTAIGQRLSGMVARNDELSQEYQAALAGIASEVTESEPSLGLLAGYLQSAIRQPALVGGLLLDDKLDAFALLADDCLAFVSVPEVTGYGRWTVRTVELALCAILTSMARVVTTSTPDSRAHAIAVAERLLVEFSDIVDALDTVAEAFNDQDWDKRYFSQTTTYTITADLIATCIRYLLKSAYDLKVEKKFTVQQPTAPVCLAITEYPGFEIERALDLLCRANALTGDEILLLAPGREIVVYI